MDQGTVTAWVGHGLSTTAILGALTGWFPPVAALAAFIWYTLQIYESDTVQTWLHTRRIRKLARLKKRMATLEAQELKSVARKKQKEDH